MHKPPSRSEDLVRELESHARKLTEMGLPEEGETELKSFDEIFAHMRELCPELVELALENNRLTELNKLVKYLGEKINNGVLAAHWLKLGDKKFTRQELALGGLKDLVRRVGMNLSSDQMEGFEGKPGELLECSLPPAVAHELYQIAYPLIVSRGLQELKGEVNEAPLPPANLNHDRFFGRVAAHVPGDILVVLEDGTLRKLTSKPELSEQRTFPISGRPKSTEDVMGQMGVAVRQEVLRQGHTVERLNLHPANDGRTIGVDLSVVDKSRPFDNKAMRDVIDRQLSSYADRETSNRQVLLDLSRKGLISEKALLEEVGLGDVVKPSQVQQATADAKTVCPVEVDPSIPSAIMKKLRNIGKW